MSETFKYVVQVDCEPSPAPHAAEIVDSLQDRFNISQHSCSGATLTVELAYGHPLANGVFKDLADALIDALTDRKLELRSGVINRVQQNWLATFTGALNQTVPRRPSHRRGSAWNVHWTVPGENRRRIAGRLPAGAGHVLPPGRGPGLDAVGQGPAHPGFKGPGIQLNLMATH